MPRSQLLISYCIECKFFWFDRAGAVSLEKKFALFQSIDLSATRKLQSNRGSPTCSTKNIDWDGLPVGRRYRMHGRSRYELQRRCFSWIILGILFFSIFSCNSNTFSNTENIEMFYIFCIRFAAILTISNTFTGNIGPEVNERLPCYLHFDYLLQQSHRCKPAFVPYTFVHTFSILVAFAKLVHTSAPILFTNKLFTLQGATLTRL